MVREIKEKMLDKAYEDKTWSEIVKAPVSAINGITSSDQEYLKKAFNVNTIQDLANNKFVRIAQTIVTLAEIEKLES